MKLKLSRLAQNYRAALGKHLADGADAELATAHKLGERAVKLGLETLDLAKMHEEALLLVMLPHHTT